MTVFIKTSLGNSTPLRRIQKGIDQKNVPLYQQTIHQLQC